MSIFSLDSKFMQVMTRVADLIILNVCFLLTCIPIITIGAASTAMYTVCFRFDTSREGGVLTSYFSAFRSNLKQATLVWLILLLFGAGTLFNTLLCYGHGGTLYFGAAFFGILFLLDLLVHACVFPLMSLFGNSFKNTMTNAVILGLGYLPRTVLAAALNILPFVLWFFNYYRFLQFGFAWMTAYFSLAAYLNTRILKKLFAPYLPKEEPEE